MDLFSCEGEENHSQLLEGLLSLRLGEFILLGLKPDSLRH